MKTEARRDLDLLEAVSQDSRVTQRRLSRRLGIALGLTNVYLKRLARKGYIKCVGVQPNRVLYLITPKGIAEKARLTCEFMEYSLFLYRQVRQHLRAVLGPVVGKGRPRIAICGTGEAAELAYLSLRELGLEPVAVFDGASRGRFLVMPVLDVHEHATVDWDLIIVASFENADELASSLTGCGIPPDKLLSLRER